MQTVSNTAYAIAAIRAQEASLPESERLFIDPCADVFVASAADAREGVDRFLALPFMRDGIRLRTRHIDDVVREAIARGTRQLVLMGAGFDARALRLPEVAAHGVQTFEIDLPALLETKRSLLAKAGIVLPGSIHHIACNFMETYETQLTADLVARGFDRARPTMFVWEGVTAYLDRAACDRALELMTSLGAPGTRLIFDFTDYLFDPRSASDHALRAGFTAFEEITLDALWRRHLPGEPPASAAIIKLGIASI